MPPVETVLKNAQIIDGTGASPRFADVAIAAGRITVVGPTSKVAAREEIDLAGRCLAPGFIDAHAHDDAECIRAPEMTAKISQGVTTVVVGNCGLSLAPLEMPSAPEEPFNLLGQQNDFRYPTFQSYADAVDAARPAVNIVALVGHSTLRRGCMADLEKEASPAELAAMEHELQCALEAGAAGMSSGVFYAPARASSERELSALAALVKTYGGVYAVHIRDEYDGVAAALAEAFRTTGHSRTPLIISHHKCAGVRNWGRSRETLALIDAAATVQPVALDCYPYTAGATILDPDLCDGEIDVLISSSEPHPECAGRSLAEVAANWKVTEREAARQLMPGFACYFQIHEDDMRRILKHPMCMVGSDGLPGNRKPHPRLWGTFPRVLGTYARDLQLFSLSEAVAKMTGLPAKHFNLVDRGAIREGAIADVTVFDQHTIQDTSTFEEPVQICKGVEWVFVAGELAWHHGRPGQRAGRFVRRNS